MAEMKKKVIDELHVLVGLPGSGKSTFADEYREYSIFSENYRYYSRKNGKKLGDIIDFDTIFKKAGFKDGLNLNYEKAASHIPYKVKYPILILDGLFVTQKEVEWVLDIYFNSDKFKNRLDIRKIVVDYWIPDKESCLWNDQGRRNEGAALSIQLLEVEKPNKKVLEEKYGVPVKLEIHTVVRKPNYKVMIDKYGVKNVKHDKYIESDTWSLGGEGHGWDGSRWDISAEEPCNFDEFDELLEKICPTITFLQYKKLYNYCVEMDERDNSDYYSRCTVGYYICDLEKLYEKLEEMGIEVI